MSSVPASPWKVSDILWEHQFDAENWCCHCGNFQHNRHEDLRTTLREQASHQAVVLRHWGLAEEVAKSTRSVG